MYLVNDNTRVVGSLRRIIALIFFLHFVTLLADFLLLPRDSRAPW